MANTSTIVQIVGEADQADNKAKNQFLVRHWIALSITAALGLTAIIWCILFFAVKLNTGFSTAIAAAVLFLIVFMSLESWKECMTHVIRNGYCV
jgi:hydrogenase-4 membrane subunit HyfE